MIEATIFDLTHPGWRDEEIARLRAENERLRTALAEVASCVQLLGLDGWSDAPHVMSVIARALKDKP